jgi:GNAT superfamily N-acetyltransferase
MPLTLRPADETDRDFVRLIYFSTQRHIIEALFGWRGDDVEEEKFASFYDMSATSIIVYDGVDVGWTTVQTRPDHIELEHLYLTPARQGHGIGSNIVHSLIEHAQVAALPLRLATAKMNRARRLYERLGFVETETDEFKVYMEWRSPIAAPRANET